MYVLIVAGCVTNSFCFFETFWNFLFHEYFLFLKKCIYLFLAVLGLCYCAGFSLVVASGAALQLWCMGFSLRWLLLLWSMDSSSCTTKAQ